MTKLILLTSYTLAIFYVVKQVFIITKMPFTTIFENNQLSIQAREIILFLSGSTAKVGLFVDYNTALIVVDSNEQLIIKNPDTVLNDTKSLVDEGWIKIIRDRGNQLFIELVVESELIVKKLRRYSRIEVMSIFMNLIYKLSWLITAGSIVVWVAG